ncbi:proline iminopeptidase [Streptomyces sp. DvalAA-14]|uniref:prolyl aminopeptidase n=1 Tax=unclassified Streptomyces TaxID=2593676 RepID=UPI00081AFB55|nr:MULTISPECIES: prolyl aminopeptidase [unclassified Streptomyces]MYS23046.1 prolyl aminopeptidase [Streptomyces sp. SID4948]SCE26528.1 proline iminopeptidase [Streptomyces sp. DvalAA-14]
MTDTAQPFPPIEPFDRGMLDVGDGQLVHWETSGNPAGKPAVLLHGGPGSGSTPWPRRLFDPEAYLIVQFDQRGAGRSTPSAADPATDLSANTTHHLIADMEQLRAHLGIRRWLVWGMSWGVTLGLAYAERYPERVSEMILPSVTMTRPAEVHWLYHEAGRFFPEQWRRFREGVPAAERDGDLVAAYYRLLNESADTAVRERAARDWCTWEDEVLSNEEGWRPNPRYDDPAFRMTFARIVTHYFHHGAWLADGQILRDAHRLAGIPGVLIHGRFDLGGPADTAWQLAEAWPDAELHLVGTGHAGGWEMTARILAASQRFARTDLAG